jgi:aspartyl-tRNA(Asn)/glutamyl-tRNA(Gln) amidotransferase subunit C
LNEPITPEIFDHLVDLAALELNREQAEYLRKQLNNQLKAIQELEAIPLDETLKITSHGVPYTAQTSALPRMDEWRPYEKPDEILAQAPRLEDGYIVVPEIPHTTLD